MKLTSSNENDIIISAVASMNLPVNCDLGHSASEVEIWTSIRKLHKKRNQAPGMIR